MSPNRWDASFLHSELLSAKTEAGEPKSDFLLKRGNPIRAALIQRPQRWNQKKMESIVRRQGGGPQARVTWSSGWAAVTSAHDLLFHVEVWKLELTWGQSHICCNSGLLLNFFFFFTKIRNTRQSGRAIVPRLICQKFFCLWLFHYASFSRCVWERERVREWERECVCGREREGKILSRWSSQVLLPPTHLPTGGNQVVCNGNSIHFRLKAVWGCGENRLQWDFIKFGAKSSKLTRIFLEDAETSFRQVDQTSYSRLVTRGVPLAQSDVTVHHGDATSDQREHDVPKANKA